MKASGKQTIRWGMGAGVGLTVIALAFLAVAAVKNGSMMSLNGQRLSSNDEMGMNMNDIAPAAGGFQLGEVEEAGCASYLNLIGTKMNESKLQETGKRYKIIPPYSLGAEGQSSNTLNIYIDENSIIEDVECD